MNTQMQQLLLQGCRRCNYNARIFSYCHLEKWDQFPEFEFRRVDANIFSDDRYQMVTSCDHSHGHGHGSHAHSHFQNIPLYLYQRILSIRSASVMCLFLFYFVFFYVCVYMGCLNGNKSTNQNKSKQTKKNSLKNCYWKECK